MKGVMLDDLMNWLSTLGGAYSSLGDYFLHHVSLCVKFVIMSCTTVPRAGNIQDWLSQHCYELEHHLGF